MTSGNLDGTTLGPYEIHEVIGRGGMSTVYRAYQPSMDRDVAVKIISSELAADPEFMARFVREAQIVAHLQHPHILPVYDFGQTNDHAYLVMRLVEGGSLTGEIKQGPLANDRVIKLVRQIASALDYAHLRGIVHRDLKPSNILLDEDGNAYLTDFGIAKTINEGTGLTVTGQVMGTPTYMAPEQWRSQPVDGRTDVYALGVIIFQMLLGQAPFIAETPHGLMYQHLDMEPPTPHTLRPELPLTVAPVLRKALAKQPDNRYASAGDLAGALDFALNTPLRLPEQTDWEARDAALDELRTQAQYYDEHTPDAALTQESAAEQATAPPSWNTQQNYQASQHAPYHAEPPAGPPAYSQMQQADQPFAPPVVSRPVQPAYDSVMEDSGIHARNMRWLWFTGAVIVGLALVIGIALIGASLAGNDNSSSTALPTAVLTRTPIPSPTLANPPRAAIQSPASGVSVELGDTAEISFTATDAEGISRVDLRRFDIVVDSLSFNGERQVSGTFAYKLDSTGTHALEIVPWRGDARGVSANVTINGR